MTKGRKKRILEQVKTLMIVLLSCSAVYLTFLTQNSAIRSGLLRTTQWAGMETDSAAEVQITMAQPMRAAAVLRSGEETLRYGVQYDDAGSSALFQQAYNLLAEALSSADQPQEVTEADWQSALAAAPGLYFDWQGKIPLEVLDGWLAVENPLLTGTVRRMALAAVAGQVRLYYYDEAAEGYYACGSDVVSVSRLEEAVSIWKENGALFAFETEEYGNLAPYTMIQNKALTPEVYTAANPLTEDTSRTALQESLGFPESAASFTAAGEQVIRSRNDTLRISTDGLVTYEPSTEGSDRYPAGTGVYDAVESCRQLAQQALGQLCGEAKLYLMSVQAQESGGWEIDFGYCLNGVQVQLGEDGWAARFTVENGWVTGFQLWVRSYTDSGAASVVLPERQAMAAMTAMGHAGEELVLVYPDTGAEEVSACWEAAGELRTGG